MKNKFILLLTLSLVVLFTGNVLAQNFLRTDIDLTPTSGVTNTDSVEISDAGTLFYISFYARDVAGLNGAEVKIGYNGTLVDYVTKNLVVTGSEVETSVFGGDAIVAENKQGVTNSVNDMLIVGVVPVGTFTPVTVADDEFAFLFQLVFMTKTGFDQDSTVNFAVTDSEFLVNSVRVEIDDANMNSVGVNRTGTDVGGPGGPMIPEKSRLGQNYPNPFNPSTTIPFEINRSGHVKISVFNVLGQQVATLVNQNFEAGQHTISFNASHLASGMYFYRMEAGDYTSMKKFVLIK